MKIPKHFLEWFNKYTIGGKIGKHSVGSWRWIVITQIAWKAYCKGVRDERKKHIHGGKLP